MEDNLDFSEDWTSFLDLNLSKALPKPDFPSSLSVDSWTAAHFLRDESWAIPLLATSAANFLTVLAFEMFVVARAFRGSPSRRHFFLGQCLILGLLLMSLSGLTFALQPNNFSCTSSRILVGVSPAIVFGALMVKCVFLVSLHSGVYLPAYYQGLLLFFIVLVQVVITIQWLATYPVKLRLAGNISSYDFFWSCEATYKAFVTSLLYVGVLILMVAVFSLKCRRVRDNYRESSYIGFSLCIIVPMWLVWTMTGFVLSERAQPACLGFGSVATSAIVFIVMFIPKGRQMSAVGKDGRFDEDRESSILSSISNEKYAPSFLMFQPITSKNAVRSATKDGCKTASSDKSEGEGSDEGIYTSINSNKNFRLSANPNFYLFRSHANIEMMY